MDDDDDELRGEAGDPADPSRPARTPDGRPIRDNWDRFAIIARPSTALLGAFVIGVLGFLADQAIKSAEEAANLRVERTESYRLYTELLSRREESESLLRQEMFKAILDEFFAGATRPEDLARPMLKLEMLALNFGESLSLSPLFVELDKQIEAMGSDGADPFRQIRQDHYRHRLHSLARRVSSWQLSALLAGGSIFEFEVPVAGAATEQGFSYPDDAAIRGLEQLQVLVPSMRDMGEQEREEYIAREIESHAYFELDEIRRRLRFVFSDADIEDRSVRVDISIRDVRSADADQADWEGASRESLPVEMSFDLNFYNFPMIDNTRLSGDQRFAMVLVDWKAEVINVACVVFPGSYASQRDRPFLTDVLERLREKAEEGMDLPPVPMREEEPSG